MRVTADGHGHPCCLESLGGTDPVGKVALRRCTDAAGRVARLEQGDIVIVEVRRMYGSEVIAEHPAGLEQLDRCASVRGKALLVLGGLLADVRVHDRSTRCRPL